MPKKILYESAIHHFLLAADRLRQLTAVASPAEAQRLAGWVRDLRIDRLGHDALLVRWSQPVAGERTIFFKGAKFYTRGDSDLFGRRQVEAGLAFGNDHVKMGNESFFDEEFRATLEAAALLPEERFDVGGDAARKRHEEQFHDEWAAGVDVAAIRVRPMNEACTAPEMRRIRRELGDLRGRRLLDLGCGLGEASVYFALEGAEVTASDISPGMLDVTRRLAAANEVEVKTHLAAAEDLQFLNGETFDIVYAGNILHHVDIAQTISRICAVLKQDGVFVSWDPVAYNPAINVYRRMAEEVRTPDEHPLRKRDLDILASHFQTSRKHFFWLTTLVIFVWMAFVQRRDPNKERYWKKVVDEADRWSPIYRPLEWLDRLILTLVPPLGYLCWNVVFIGRNPRRKTSRWQ